GSKSFFQDLGFDRSLYEIHFAKTTFVKRRYSYASELIPSSPSINPSNDNRISLNIQSTSSNVSPSIDATSMSPWASSHFIHDMPIVKTIGLLFNISHSQLQKDLNLIRNWCTEKSKKFIEARVYFVSPNLSKFDLSLSDTLKAIADLQEDFNDDHQDQTNQISPSIDPDLATHRFTYIPPNQIKSNCNVPCDGD
ncbi:hypothetical protein O181_105682, partial [Austropuccinia psidii MF-1]|nr:hypothetical protein [Austropuccinia psidii MF-1]